MRPKSLFFLALPGIVVVIGALSLWALPEPSAENKPGPPRDAKRRESASPQGLTAEPNRLPLYGFEAKEGDTLRLSFNLEALRRARTISYPDPTTGERLTTNPLERERGLGATSLLGAVPVAGQARPATITLGDEGTVILTLPYSRGVLSGEGDSDAGGLGAITLLKAPPFKDVVRAGPEALLPSAPRGSRPSCVNCL